jgi:hypothetical protein
MARGPRLGCHRAEEPPGAHSAQGQRRGPADRRPGPVHGVLPRAGLGAAVGLNRRHVAVQDHRQPPAGLHRRSAANRWPPHWRASRPARPSRRFTWPATTRSTPRSKQPSGPVGRGQGGRSHPTGGSYGFFADPTGMSGRSSTTRPTGSGPTGDPRSPRPGVPVTPQLTGLREPTGRSCTTAHLRAREDRLTAVRTCVSAGGGGPSGAKLGVLIAGPVDWRVVVV